MWEEIADGVFRRRYEWVDLNIGLVIGGDGALVIDTRTTPAEGRRLLDDVAELTPLPVRWAVNTHWHWDHVLGNAAFGFADLWGHEACAARLASEGAADVAAALAWFPAERHGELTGVIPVAPGSTFTKEARIDLGGRTVAMRHHGLGHTDADISIEVEGTGIAFAGDLLESGAPPYFGDGYPLAWPGTLRRHLDEHSTFVPGHGAVMPRAVAMGQLEDLEAVAEVCARALADGTPAEKADLTGAPYPEETMRTAVARGIAEAGRRGADDAARS